MLPAVLVVDDDPLVREMLDAALSSYGLDVRTAGSGRQALDVYRQHRGGIGVVLLDVTMRGLDGPHTLAALREIDSGVRCFFMSGFTTGYLPKELLAFGALDVLNKPFRDLGVLAGTLREVLDGAVR